MSDFANSKRRRLIDALIRKTTTGEIEWKQTIEEDTFKVDFSRSSLQLSEQKRRATDYVITLINQDGQIADTFSDNDLDDRQNPEFDDGSGYIWYNKMKELFSNARRAALGSDKVLDDILGEIDDDLPF